MAPRAYSAQQMLRLQSDFHRAFVQGDAATLRSYCETMLLHIHLLRPTEAAMVLNHMAQAKMTDSRFWQPFSDAFPHIFIDVDDKAVGIAANAYGRVMLKHDAALNTLSVWARRLASRGRMDGKPMAMVVNGFSRLRVRDQALMDLLATQLVRRADELNEVDIATIMNAYARLVLNNDALFEALEEPTRRCMSRFTGQNLAMIANAHARLQRPNDELLSLVTAELRAQCERGRPVPANLLPSIVHALVSRLEFCPPDLTQVVQYSLPRVIANMEKSDVVLTVPPLAHMLGLRADVDFCGPVFGRCLEVMGKLTHGAMTSLVHTASQLLYSSPAFWREAVRQTTAAMSCSTWEGKYVATLTFSVAKVVISSRGAAGPEVLSPMELQDFLRCVERSAMAARDPLDAWDAANLATGCAHLGLPQDSPLVGKLSQRARVLLSPERGETQAVGDAATRLLASMSALGVWPAELGPNNLGR